MEILWPFLLLLLQSIPPTIWYRLVAGLNAQLRLARRGHLKSTFHPVIQWIETHANSRLRSYGLRVKLTRLLPSGSGYCQFGLVVSGLEDENSLSSSQGPDRSLLLNKDSRLPASLWRKAFDLIRSNEQALTQKRIYGETLNEKNLQKLEHGLTLNPFYYIIRNIKPVCHQDLVGLIVSILLLGDFSLVLLLLLQLYSISLPAVSLVLSISPLGILLPFPAGINALFSQGPKRSAGLARVYALWNLNSVINVVVAFICGLVHFQAQSNKKLTDIQSWNFSMDESGWWMLPCGLLFCKLLQARLIDCHVANLEIQDRTLYSNDPHIFWQS